MRRAKIIIILRDKFGNRLPYTRCSCGTSVSVRLNRCPMCHRIMNDDSLKEIKV